VAIPPPKEGILGNGGEGNRVKNIQYRALKGPWEGIGPKESPQGLGRGPFKKFF